MASSRFAATRRRAVGRHRRPSRANVVVPTGVTGGLLLASAATGVATAGAASASVDPSATTSSSSSSSAGAATASQTSSNLPTYPHLLSRGDTGKYVEMVQDELGVATDGIFGPVTENAVKEFQSNHGLVVDGLVGPVTWGALRGSRSGSGGTSSGGGSSANVQTVSYSGSSSGSSTASQALDVALSQTDDPYVFGAEGPEAFDCSGLINYAYSQVGVELPRTTDGLIGAGESVSRSELQPGDLVFTSSHHVGLYVGNGKMVSARNSEEDIGVHPIWDFYAGVSVTG